MRHVALVSFLTIGALQAQSPGKLTFDVASVKPAKPPRLPNFPLNNGDAKPPGGRFSASFSLPAYILFAYKLDAFQGKEMNAQLPKWASEDYAIDAEAEGNPTKDQMRLMMQSLLADRFKLKVHFETQGSPRARYGFCHSPANSGRSCVRILRVRRARIHLKWITHLLPPPPPTKAGVVFPTAVRNYCPSQGNLRGYLDRVAEYDHGVACQ